MTDFPAPPAAPPTEPDPRARLVLPPAWPTILGVICVVFGAGAGLAGLFSLIISTAVMTAVETDVPRFWMIGWQAGSVVVAALLLVGGVQLLRRRGSAAGLLRVWAVLKLLFVLSGLMIGYQVWQASPHLLSGVEILLLVLNGAWGAALPVFVLVWFSRCRVKADLAAHFSAGAKGR